MTKYVTTIFEYTDCSWECGSWPWAWSPVIGYPKRCQLVEIIVERYDGMRGTWCPQDIAWTSSCPTGIVHNFPLAAICPSHPSDKWRLISPRTCVCDQVCSEVVWCQICPIAQNTEEKLIAPLPLLVPGKLCPFPQQLHQWSCHLLVDLATFVIIGKPALAMSFKANFLISSLLTVTWVVRVVPVLVLNPPGGCPMLVAGAVVPRTKWKSFKGAISPIDITFPPIC